MKEPVQYSCKILLYLAVSYFIHTYILFFFKSNPYLRKKGWLYTFYWRFWKEHKPGVFGAYNGVFISLVLQYSTSRKSLIFCFALLLLQIVVNFQNQGPPTHTIWPSFGWDTVLADKIRSNIFRAVFWTPGLVPVILDIAYLVALVLRIPNWYYTSL